jgi:hypothetical protein
MTELFTQYILHVLSWNVLLLCSKYPTNGPCFIRLNHSNPLKSI